MKTIIFSLLFTLMHQFLVAQNGFNILYESRWSAFPLGSPPIYKIRLLVKDSICYQYSFPYHDKGKKPYGSKPRGHSTYKNISSNLMLTENKHGTKSRYLIRDTIPKLNWDLLPDQKNVLNYICKNAHVRRYDKSY